MNDKINGFVLSLSDYKDNDVIMQTLTKDYGVISLVAKAAKKLNSKNHFLPMCIYEFIIDYKYGKSIFSIHGSKLINSFFESDDINLISFKNILCELSLKNKDIDTYDQLSFVFNNINKDNIYLLGSMYLSYLIKSFGITPIVDSCALCNNKEVVSFSSSSGGFLCKNHLNGEDTMNIETLRKIRLIIKAEFKDYEIMKQFNYDFNDFDILMNFYMHNTDLKINSYELYKKIH